jgi:hypothetical protein
MTNATETAPANPSPSSEPVPKRFQCRHILTSGRRCRSASLHGEQFCYYHHTTRRPAPRHRGVHPAQSIFEMPLIDDREGIQFALAQILNRLTTGQLDPKRANPILYTLKLAIWNLHETRPAAAPRRDSRDSRESSSSSSRESISTDPNANDTNEFVEDLILDEDLGPIAPIAEIHPPELPQARPSFLADLLRDLVQSVPEEQPASAPNSSLLPSRSADSLSSRSADSLSSRSADSLSSRSAAEGSASPHSDIPQPTTNT